MLFTTHTYRAKYKNRHHFGRESLADYYSAHILPKGSPLLVWGMGLTHATSEQIRECMCGVDKSNNFAVFHYKIRTKCRGGGVNKSQNLADVTYGSFLIARVELIGGSLLVGRMCFTWARTGCRRAASSARYSTPS